MTESKRQEFIRAPVVLDCWMETTPLTASMTTGMSVSTHGANDPVYLPPKLLLPSLKLMDTVQVGTTNDEAYAGKTAASREVFVDKRESGTDKW